jgi:hypothetical protein
MVRKRSLDPEADHFLCHGVNLLVRRMELMSEVVEKASAEKGGGVSFQR